MEGDQDFVEVDVHTPNLQGGSLRDLRPAPDTIVMAVKRNWHVLIAHGYTQLEIGDRVTLLGAVDSLKEISLRFEEPN